MPSRRNLLRKHNFGTPRTSYNTKVAAEGLKFPAWSQNVPIQMGSPWWPLLGTTWNPSQAFRKFCTIPGKVLKPWQSSKKILSIDGNFIGQRYFPDDVHPAQSLSFVRWIMHKHGIACNGGHAIKKSAVRDPKFGEFHDCDPALEEIYSSLI